ncbi:MAG TPA: hypothetical protein VK121_02745 [Pseudogracilibacillus sp.]|nr:hypothetical protein [Pseudogracilibacillus sp.]
MKLIETKNELHNQSKHAKRFLKLDNAQFVNIQMKKDELLSEHHAKEAVIIVVRKGKIELNIEGEKVIVTTENVLHMDPLEKHDVLAIEDSDFILVKVN